MNKRDEKYIKTLARLAVTVEPVRKARMAACLVQQNEIIAFGINQLKSHPFQAKFAKNKDSIYLHAEIDCIKNALKVIQADDLKRCTMYVCRMKFEDTRRRRLIYGLACPCSGCAQAIAAFRIRKVIYSKNEEV